jgi:hypothetical protein
MKKIIKNAFTFCFIILATLIFVQCASKNKYRAPNASGEAVVDGNTVEVAGGLGTVIVDWNQATGDDHGAHRPSYESVHLNLSVVCNGSNTPIPFSTLKVCHFLGTDVDNRDNNIIYIGYQVQGLPIVEVNQGQLQIIRENDRLCNETKEAVFDLKEICSNN